jgi:hypothetical protein
MCGEFLREAAVLVALFGPLELMLPIVGLSAMVALAAAFGIWRQRRARRRKQPYLPFV